LADSRSPVGLRLGGDSATSGLNPARYRAIEAGLAAWGISGFFVGGGLICEWAGYPLLVIDLDLL
jgi:hypothetical protein